MFPGIEFKTAKRTLIIPALSIRQLREGGLELIKETDKLAAENDTNGYGTMASRADLIFMALQRNYPDIEKSEVEDALDLGNVVRLWLQVLGVSGMDGKSSTGEEQAPAAAATAETAQTLQ